MALGRSDNPTLFLAWWHGELECGETLRPEMCDVSSPSSDSAEPMVGKYALNTNKAKAGSPASPCW